jgi:hypothetical protein
VSEPTGDVPQLVGHVAQRVHAYRATKSYVCPACGNEIPSGMGHVVAWPEAMPDYRRHWHTHCWRIESGRGSG